MSQATVRHGCGLHSSLLATGNTGRKRPCLPVLALFLGACTTNTPSTMERGGRSPSGGEAGQMIESPAREGSSRAGSTSSAGEGLPDDSQGGDATTPGQDSLSAGREALDTTDEPGPAESNPGVAHVFVGSTDGQVRAYLAAAADGSLAAAGVLDSGPGLDFLNASADGRTVFVSRAASVSAYQYDPQTDQFTELDTAETAGGGTHVAVAPNGRLVVVAHYNEGAITALPFVGGQFGNAQVLQPGANAHQVHFGGAGRHLFIPCLGSDHLAQFSVRSELPPLRAATPATAPAPGGPRHMAWHPSLPVAYALAENTSQLHVFDRGPDGLLQRRSDGSVHTEADEQYHWSSDVQVTADGRHLFAVNRTPSQLVRFNVSSDGSLARAENYALQGVIRSFAVDSANHWLFVGGTTGTLVTYRLDSGSGALSASASLSGLSDIHSTQVRYIL